MSGKSSSIPGISVGKWGLWRPDRLLLDPEISAGQRGGFLAAYGGRAAQQRVRRTLGQAAVHCQRDGGILASAQNIWCFKNDPIKKHAEKYYNKM